MDEKSDTVQSMLAGLKRFVRNRWTIRIGLGLGAFGLLLGLLFWSLLFNPFEADHEGELAALVPSSVSLYLGATDLRTTWHEYADSSDRARMADSEHWKRFFRSPLWRLSQEGIGLAGLERVLSGLESTTGPLLTEQNILELFGRELAVAARLDGAGGVEGLVLARVGFRGKLVIAGLHRAISFGQVEGEMLPYGVPIARIGQGAGAIYLGRIADVVLVSTSQALVEEVLLARKLKGEGSLARSPRFQAALRGEGHGVRVFVDFERADRVLEIKRLLGRVRLPFPLPLFVYFLTESVDINALELISGRFYFVGGAYDRIYWEGNLTFRESQLADYHKAFYRQRPQQFISFDMLPEQLLFARVLKMDPELAWEFAQESMGQALRDWFVKLDRIAREQFKLEGSAIDELILPLLGQEFGVLLTRINYFDAGEYKSAEYPLPGLVLLIRSPDSAQLVARLDELFSRPHKALSTGRIKLVGKPPVRYSVFELEVGFPGLKPCYGAVGDFFVLASHPLGLQQMRDVLDGYRPPARIEKVGPELRNLRVHLDFGQMSKVVHDLAPKFAEEIITNRVARIRAELDARLGRPAFEREVTRVREVRTEIRSERMRKGIRQYQIFKTLDVEWTANRTSLRCVARLKFNF